VPIKDCNIGVTPALNRCVQGFITSSLHQPVLERSRSACIPLPITQQTVLDYCRHLNIPDLEIMLISSHKTHNILLLCSLAIVAHAEMQLLLLTLLPLPGATPMPMADLRSCVATWLYCWWLSDAAAAADDDDMGPPGAALAAAAGFC